MIDFINFKRLTGCTIVIVTEDGEYEGILRIIIPDVKQISLSNVVMLPNRLPLCGLQNFFEPEIKTYRVIKQLMNPSDKKPEPQSVIGNEQDLKLKPPPLKSVSVTDESQKCSANSVTHVNDEILETDSGSDKCNYNEYLTEKYFPKLPKNLSHKLPKDFAVINEIDDDFYDAIHYIGEQSSIGVSFHGISIGRSGELSIIGISTNFCTFLFDIHSLKMKAFENGLKRIFEDIHVKKVIHNCRQPSDCLFHQYNTKLTAVNDTQLSDVFARLQDRPRGKLPQYTNKLGDCLSCHLKLANEHIYNVEISEAHMKGDLSVWNQRPISSNIKDAVIKSVIYLKELQNVLLEKIMTPFGRAVDFYLSHKRDATLEEMELEPAFSHRMPHEIRSLQIQTVKYDDFEKKTAQKNQGKIKNYQMPLDQFVQNFERHCKKEMPVIEKFPNVSNNLKKKYSCSQERRLCSQTLGSSTTNSIDKIQASVKQPKKNQISTSSSGDEKNQISSSLLHSSASASSTSEESDVSFNKTILPIIWPNIPSTFSNKAQLIPAGMEHGSRQNKKYS